MYYYFIKKKLKLALNIFLNIIDFIVYLKILYEQNKNATMP